MSLKCIPVRFKLFARLYYYVKFNMCEQISTTLQNMFYEPGSGLR